MAEVAVLVTGPEPFGYERYGSAKRKRYSNVLSTSSMVYSNNEARAFIKDSRTAVSGTARDEFESCQVKAPRMIQYLPIATNAVFASVYHSIEVQYYERQYRGYSCIAKRHNLLQRGRLIRELWDTLVDPVVILGDMAKYDAHIRQWKTIFETMMNEVSSLDEYKGLTECLRMLTRFVLSYPYDRRISGEYITGFGNQLRSAVDYELLFSDLQIEAYYYSDGDDTLVFIESKDLKAYTDYAPEFFRKRGLTYRIDGVAHNFDKIEFCQCRPVRFTEGYSLVRSPGKILQTLLFTRRRVYDVAYFATVAECLWNSAPGLPILGVLEKSMMSWTNKRAALDASTCYMERQTIVTECQYTKSDYASAFDMDPRSIENWEVLYSHLAPPSFEINQTAYWSEDYADMGIPIYGNYVGPGYTGGVVDPGPEGDYGVEPVDELDAIAREHDYRYEHGSSIASADRQMAWDIITTPAAWFDGPGDLGILAAVGMAAKSFWASDSGVSAESIVVPSVQQYKMMKNKKNANKPVQPATKKVSMQKPQKSSAKGAPVVQAAPAAQAVVSRSPKFELISARPGCYRARRKELLGDVIANAGASLITTYAINPGNPVTFGYLAAIASRFEKYRVIKLRFVFETSSPTSNFGNIAMAFDFDAADPSPSFLQNIYRYDTFVKGAVWSPYLILDVPASKCNGALKEHFITNTSPVDVKTYHVGNLIIGNNANNAATNLAGSIGQVFVEYDFELIEPSETLNPEIGQWIVAPYTLSGGNIQLATANITTYYSDVAITLNAASANIMSFLTEGVWNLQVVGSCTTVATGAFYAVPTSANANIVVSNNFVTSLAVGSSGCWYTQNLITVNVASPSAPASLSFAVQNSATAATYPDLWINIQRIS